MWYYDPLQANPFHHRDGSSLLLFRYAILPNHKDRAPMECLPSTSYCRLACHNKNIMEQTIWHPYLSNPRLSSRRVPYLLSWSSFPSSKDAPTYAKVLHDGLVLSPNCNFYISKSPRDSHSQYTYQHSMKYLNISLHFNFFSGSSFSFGIGCRTI